jgi:hypothetical protein
LLIAAPASAAKRPRLSAFAWSITDAALSEHVSFQGDGGPACQQAGVCGFNGTVDYGFGGIEEGDIELVLLHHAQRTTAVGFGEIFENSLTKATVNPPGGGAPCTEQALHHEEILGVQRIGGRIRLAFHDPRLETGPIRSYCTQPSDADLWHAHAIPYLWMRDSALRQKRQTLSVSTTRSFHSGPFSGQVTFQATLHLRRVKLPAFLVQLLTGA